MKTSNKNNLLRRGRENNRRKEINRISKKLNRLGYNNSKNRILKGRSTSHNHRVALRHIVQNLNNNNNALRFAGPGFRRHRNSLSVARNRANNRNSRKFAGPGFRRHRSSISLKKKKTSKKKKRRSSR
jgi:hypothetical protein